MLSGTKKNILVTGGAGFIGSNLVDELIKMGHNVSVIDNESSSSNSIYYWNNKAKNYKEDICNYDNTKEIYNNIDYVFHMAAQARIQKGIDNPLESFKVNSYGTSVVMQCAKEAGVKKVIYSSSSSVYGNGSIPNNENNTIDCLNPYSISKLQGEEICKIYSKVYNLDTVILRYFNVYGPRQSYTGKYATVIGVFQERLKNNLKLQITGDGTQKRDFTHVQDIVNANILIMNSSNSFNGEVFNVGCGINYSINEIAKLFNGSIEYIAKRPGENKETLADNNKIKNIVGWSPTINLKEWVLNND